MVTPTSLNAAGCAWAVPAAMVEASAAAQQGSEQTELH